MATIPVNNIREGNILEYKDRLWVVLNREHVKPGKGGAFVQAELKDIISGTKLNERFRSEETVEQARIDEVDYQFLFKEGDDFVLMHVESYEQESFNIKLFNEKERFLQDGMIVKVAFHDSRPIWISLPDNVVLEVVEAEPVIRGQTATASYKPAILENGVRIMVPPFVEVGERVKVKTIDGTYVERAKDK